ncbi:adenosine deaminase [bacterium]|nr:adenosine deaminase [bacterium]
MMVQNKTFELIKRLPKAELHVHLEGSVTPEFWKHLLEKHCPLDPIPSLDELQSRFRYDSFQGFIDVYRDIIFSFRSPHDFYELTQLYLKNAVKQNIRYVEMMMTPWFIIRQGIDLDELLSEIDRAAKEIEKDSDIDLKLIFDGPRNFGKEIVQEVFNMAAKDRTGRVIGVGLGGDEKNYPALLFIDCFDYARAEGFNTIAHAGETAGAQSMLDTIKLLKVSRLGHCLGIPRASELESLVFEKGVTLDLCPLSNVATRAIASIEQHPMFEYLQRGYPITLNSDDPGMFTNSLTLEYETLLSLHAVSAEQLGQLSKNAVQGSFLNKTTKNRLITEIEQVGQDFGQ